MVRVVGIDPGTVGFDLCGLDDTRVLLDRALPTAEVAADPGPLVRLLEAAEPLDLIGTGCPSSRSTDSPSATSFSPSCPATTTRRPASSACAGSPRRCARRASGTALDDLDLEGADAIRREME